MAPFQMKIIRGLFNVGELVAPKLAGRAAFWLFCRTNDPNKLTAGEKRANDRAQPLMQQARRHRLTTTSGWVVAYEFRPEIYNPAAPVALIVHGWRSRTEHMTGLVRMARDLGYRVISLDLPGHGRSGGRWIHMVNAVAAVKAAETWFGPFDTMIGHSFGGAVVCNAVFGSVKQIEKVEANRLVMISAPNKLSGIFDWFATKVGLGPKSKAAMAHQVFRLSGSRIGVFSAEDQLVALKQPCLIVHAPDDKQVDFAGAEAMARAGDHVRLLQADGLGHSRIIADAGVLAQIAAFLQERKSRLAA